MLPASGVTIVPEPTNNQKKPDGRASSLWALGVILLMLGIAFSIGWATRGQEIHDFTGIGQAEILKSTTIRDYLKERNNSTKYRYQVHITAGEVTFYDRYEHSGETVWQEGEIVPIAYNINNPREYVIGSTPEEYIQWYATIGICALSFMLGAAVCFGVRLRIERRIAEKAEGTPESYV